MAYNLNYEEIVEFLSKPENEIFLKKNDFDSLYRRIDDNSRGVLTDFLYTELNIDVLKYMKRVPRYFIVNSTQIKSITIPDTVASVDQYSFSNSKSLSNVLITGNVKLFRNSFADNSSLSTVIIKGGVVEIPDYCFANCSALKKVELPSTVKSIGNNAFENCPDVVITTPKRDENNRLVMSPRTANDLRGKLKFSKSSGGDEQ